MIAYIIRRIWGSIIVIVLVSVVLFFMMRLLPGDIADLVLRGSSATAVPTEQLNKVRHQFGLDQPLPVQYVKWAWSALHGDLGASFYNHQSVSVAVFKAIPVNIELAVLTFLISLSISIPAGVIAAVDQDGAIDYPVRLLTILGLAIPGFFLAIVVITLFSIWFGISPPVTYVTPWSDVSANLQLMIWPAVALAASLLATVTRMIRASLLETMRQDYVRTARAKGLSGRRVILQHALRNALIPTVTVIGGQVSYVLGGSVVMEQIFLLPGLGRLGIQAIDGRDYFMLQGVVLIFAVIVVLVNLVVDLSYSFLDPRIRFA